jgi:hypothetical protein
MAWACVKGYDGLARRKIRDELARSLDSVQAGARTRTRTQLRRFRLVADCFVERHQSEHLG